MLRRLARLLFVLALAATAPAHAAEEPVRDVVTALNATRSARGLAPVVERRELSRAAQAHADDMAARRYLSLDPPGDGAFRDRFRHAGYIPAATSTLVVAGYPDAGLLIESLAGEEQFAGDLLDPAVGEIGVGYRAEPYRINHGDIVTHAWILVLSRTNFPPVPDASGALVEAINRARGGRGLPAVAAASALSAAALDHVSDMIARGFVAHESPDGKRVDDRVRRHGYEYRLIGENIAFGHASPDAVIQGWTDSPGHARILYHPEFREVGTGYLPGPVVETTRSFGHVWVAVFGLRQNSVAAPDSRHAEPGGDQQAAGRPVEPHHDRRPGREAP